MGEVLDNTALTRIKQLVDAGSFVELQSDVVARNTDFMMNHHQEISDGVVTGYGLIEGRLVFLYSQNPDVLNGSMGEMHCRKIMETYLQAVKVGAPVIGIIDCSGFRLEEAADAMDGFGDVLMALQDASGSVPLFTVIYGNCGGGLSLIPAMSDFNYMVKGEGRLFVNSPNTLEGNYKDKSDTSSCDFQTTYSGIVDDALSIEEIQYQIVQLLQFLPANNTEGCIMVDSQDDLNRAVPNMNETNFDLEQLVLSIADDSLFIETKKDFAKDMLTGFIRLNGISVGVIGNREEILTTSGMDKAAAFVRFCDAFDVPLLTISDAVRFDTTCQEEKSLARTMASYSSAILDAEVPKVCLIPRHAYGTPYLLMNSKSIGADLVYAWPNAQIGAMKAELAVKILNETKEGKENPVSATEYMNSHNSSSAQARRGYVHKLIAPEDTRKYLLSAFDLLYTKNKSVAAKKNSLR